MHETTRRLLMAISQATGIDGQARPSEAAARLGVTHQRLTNWMTRGVSKDGQLLANSKLHINPRWIEAGEQPMLIGRTGAVQAATDGVKNLGKVTNSRVSQTLILDGSTVPVLRKEQVMSSKEHDLFVYVAPDSALEPQVERGAEVVWCRSRSPRYGKPVLVEVGQELHIRIYEQGRSPGQWIARAINPGYASFDSSSDSVSIVACWRGVLDPE